jgi:hypothetical protein
MRIPDGDRDVMMQENTTVRAVLRCLCRNPNAYLRGCWNWKSALLGSLARAALFFAVNAGAGYSAALAAMLAEFGIRIIGAGFYGGVIESFRSAKPRWAATLIVLVVLPLFNHSAEFLLHWIIGSPNLKASMLATIAFTILSTSFSLYAMRKDIFTTGHNCRSLSADLRLMPHLLLDYFCAVTRLPRTALVFFRDLFRRSKAIPSFSSGQEAGRAA